MRRRAFLLVVVVAGLTVTGLTGGCSGSTPSNASDAGALRTGGVDGGGPGGAVPGAGTDGGVSGAGQDGGAGTDGASGFVGPAGPPQACAASDVGNTALGTDTPDATGTAASAITYTNVGVSGSYDKVVTSTVAPTCVANVCQKAAKAVSGPLVPFDEEMTLVFSGPMDLYQVAAYAPDAAGYARVAYWDRCTTEGLAFVGNKASAVPVQRIRAELA